MVSSLVGKFPDFRDKRRLERFVQKIRRFQIHINSLEAACKKELVRFQQIELPPNTRSPSRLSEKIERSMGETESIIHINKYESQDEESRSPTQYLQSPKQKDPQMKRDFSFLFANKKNKTPRNASISPERNYEYLLSKINRSIGESLIPPEESRKQSIKASHLEQAKVELSLPPIQSGSVLSHRAEQKSEEVKSSAVQSGSIIFDTPQEGQVFQKYLKSANLQDYYKRIKKDGSFKFIPGKSQLINTEVEEYVSAFHLFSEEIALKSSPSPQILAILKVAQDSIIYSVNQNNLTIQGFNKFTVLSIMSDIKMREEYQNEKIWYFLLSEEQALLLKVLAQNHRQNYIKLFKNIKVSEVVQDPATKLFSLMYRCPHQEIDFIEGELANSLSGLVATKINMTSNVYKVLSVPQSLSPQCTVLSKMQKLHNSTIIKNRDLMTIQDSYQLTNQQFSFEDEETKLNLKFKVEGKSCEFQELYVISSSYQENAKLLAALNSEVEYLEKYKIHLLDREGPSQGSTEQGSLNWDKCTQLYGERLNKTENGLAFQNRFGVYIFYEVKQPKRILIYGGYNNQRLAYTELASILSNKQPNRVSVELDEKSYILLQGSISKQIEKKMQQIAPGLKIYYHESRAQKYYAVIFYDQMFNTRVLSSIYNKAKKDVLCNLESVAIPRELWDERDTVQNIIIRNQMQLTIERNSSLQPLQIVISEATGPVLWLRSENRADQTNDYEEYSIQKCKQIEGKYKAGHSFFEIEESSFSLHPGRVETWSQISKTGQYRVKRIAIRNEPKSAQMYQLGPREQLVIGFAQEIKEFESHLAGLESVVRKDKSVAIAQYLQKKQDEKIEMQIQSKYGVKTNYQEDLCTVFLKGELRYYAQRELNEYYAHVVGGPNDTSFITNEERNRVISLFQTRWMGSHTPFKIELEKLRNPVLLANYIRERSVLQRRSGKKDVEMELFQQQDNLQNERQFFHNISMSIRNKKKQPFSVVLFRVLVGKKLRVREEREFIAPVKVGKLAQRNKNKLSSKSFSEGSLNSSKQFQQEYLPENPRFYDILELRTDLGSSYQIFDGYHAYPTYRIVFRLKF